jgi:hypothetical protein
MLKGMQWQLICRRGQRFEVQFTAPPVTTRNPFLKERVNEEINHYNLKSLQVFANSALQPMN